MPRLGPEGNALLYAFVDESTRDEDYYFLSAVVCTEAQVEFLERELTAVLLKHGETFETLHAGVELHASQMMRAVERPWRRIPIRVRFALYEDCLRVIAASGARIYIEGVNVPAQIARGYAVVTPARELCFSHLLEQINGCCSQEEPVVQVIADEHHTAQQSRSDFRRYQIRGTYGYRSSRLPNIAPEIRFEKSDLLRGLQAADLVTYIYNRWLTVKETDERAHLAKQRLWAILEPRTRWPEGRERTWPHP